MTRSALTWTILCTATAVVGGVGIVAWHMRPQYSSFVTDAGDTGLIRVPAEGADTRDVRWHPPAAEQSLRSGLDTRDPVLDAAGRTIYFARGRSGADADIYVAERGADGWTAPRPLAGVNTGADELGPHPSPDGRALYFASDRPGGVGLYDLWVTRRGSDDEWLPPENLGPSVNSRYNDHAPAVAPNGRLLCFASNRPRPDVAGAPGPDAWPSEVRAFARTLDDDLYAADLGDFSATGPVALAELNGPFDDTAPAVSPVGDFVYFASNRPGGAGGFDLYRSRRARGSWLPPDALGEGVNTVADELDPSSSLGGFGLHFATDRGAPGAEKVYDILFTTSREVFTETETFRARLDLGLLWEILRPYLFALGVMALAVVALLRALKSIRHRGLSLIVQALIGSIVVHMVLLVGFAFWSVTGSRGGFDEGGGVVAVTIFSPMALGAPAVAMNVGFMSTEAVLSPADGVGQGEADVVAQAAAEEAALTLERIAMSGAQDPTVAADGREAPALEAAPGDAAPPELTAVELALAPPAPAPAAGAGAPRDDETRAYDAVVTVANLPGRTYDDAAGPVSAGAAIAVRPAGDAIGSAEARLGAHSVQFADAQPSLPNDGGRSGPSEVLAALPTLPLPALREAPHAVAPQDAPGSRAEAVASTAARRAGRGAQEVAAQPGSGARDAAPRPVAVATAAPATAGHSEPSLAPRQVHESAGAEARPASAPAVTASAGATPGGGLAALPRLTLPGLPEQRSSSANAAGEEKPGPEGLVGAITAARADRDPWAAAGSRAGAQDARPAPNAIASTPEALVVEPADLEPALVAESALAILDRPRPELSALESLDLDLALPRRLIPVPFQQRAQEKRQEILQDMGGDMRTEEAVVRALDWLARHQSPDGHWDCTEYDDRCGSCRGMGQARADIALTGLSLLCYLAVDHTPDKKGPHRETVARALDWLLQQQKQGGNLMGGDIESMYSHGIATIALAEAYGMTGDERFEQPVRRAVEFIHRSQAMRGGGWRYTPGQAGDTSVTGWQVMALAAAREANIAVPDAAIEVGSLWMERLADPAAPGIYSYQPSYEPSAAMTAEGMFIRQLLGVPRYDLAMRASARHLTEHLPTPEGPPNSYYWYYATLALFQHQGDEWRAWNEALKPMLLGSQVPEGPAAGSWAVPVGDRWANVGGRVYQTAICTLTLEAYYRYLPRFLQANGGVPE